MDVHARYAVYPQSSVEQAETSSGTPAVVFEHGAGKLQGALHLILAGKGPDDVSATNPLNKATIDNILRQGEEAGEHIGQLDDTETVEAAQVLNQVDFVALLGDKTATDFQNDQIYPDIWGDEKVFTEIRAELTQRFKELATFYQAAAEQHCSVVARTL